MLVAVHTDLARLRRCGCAGDTRARERLHVELVHAGQDGHVVVHHRVALGLRRFGEVVGPSDAVHHESARLVTPSVHVGHRDPVLVEQPLAQHLVLEREDAGEVMAVSPNAQLEQLVAAGDVGEPHRPPPGLPLDPHHTAVEL